MDLSNCWDCGSDFISYALASALFFFAPVGAFVLRKHIAAATGLWKLAGRALQAMAVVSLPFAVLLVLSVVLQTLMGE